MHASGGATQTFRGSERRQFLHPCLRLDQAKPDDGQLQNEILPTERLVPFHDPQEGEVLPERLHLRKRSGQPSPSYGRSFRVLESVRHSRGDTTRDLLQLIPDNEPCQGMTLPPRLLAHGPRPDMSSTFRWTGSDASRGNRNPPSPPGRSFMVQRGAGKRLVRGSCKSPAGESAGCFASA